MKQKSATITVGAYVCVRPSYIQAHYPDPAARRALQKLRGFVAAIITEGADPFACVARIVVDGDVPHHPSQMPYPAPLGHPGCVYLSIQAALMPVPPSIRLDARSLTLDHRG